MWYPIFFDAPIHKIRLGVVVVVISIESQRSGLVFANVCYCRIDADTAPSRGYLYSILCGEDRRRLRDGDTHLKLKSFNLR